LIDRIIDHQRLAYHVARANKTPAAAVERVLPVIAEDKIRSCRHNDFSIHSVVRKHLITFRATGPIGET